MGLIFIIIRWETCCLEFGILFMVPVAFQFIPLLAGQGTVVVVDWWWWLPRDR